MVYEEAYFDTEVEAEQEGKRLEAAWGWGYNLSYRVRYDTVAKTWVLSTSRYSSCD